MKLKDLRTGGYLKTWGGIILALLFLKFLLQPFFSGWNELNAQIQLNESRFYKALKLISQKDEIISTFKEISQRVDRKQLELKEAEEVKIFLYRFLNQLASNYNVKLRTLRPKGEGTGYREEEALYFEIEAEAKLEDLLKFLYQLENPYNLTSIEELKLTPLMEGRLLLRLKIKRKLI
jgi:predicted DNA-binding ribbon-helix-helix protein